MSFIVMMMAKKSNLNMIYVNEYNDGHKVDLCTIIDLSPAPTQLHSKETLHIINLKPSLISTFFSAILN